MLGRHEVDQLIQCTANLEHRTFLMTLYSGGLRFAEAAAFKLHHIDSKRMQIRIASGTEGKERLVPLTETLERAQDRLAQVQADGLAVPRQGSATEKLTVHQLLRRHAERYVAKYRDSQATMSVQSTLAKLSLCRTSALGGRWYNCDNCGRSLDAAGIDSNLDVEFLSDENGECESATVPPTLCCEHCGSESLRLSHEFTKPTWDRIFGRDSESSPSWYRESQEIEDIRFWDGARLLSQAGEVSLEWYAW